MKNFKRIAALVFAGFLAFAPPGTIILSVIFIAGLIGNIWVTVGVMLTLILLGGRGLIAAR